MVPHKYRIFAVILFALAEIALTLLSAFDVLDAATTVKIGVSLGGLFTALMGADVGVTEMRRRDPHVPALRDDVRDSDDLPAPRRGQPPTIASMLLVIIAASSVTIAMSTMTMLSGCSGAAAQHRGLNTLTTIADPTYAEAVELCDTLRDRVIARPGTTYEEDRADMDSIHEVCDAMVAGFESLRSSQLTARAAIASGVEGAIRDAIREGLRLWPIAQQLVDRIQERGQR